MNGVYPRGFLFSLICGLHLFNLRKAILGKECNSSSLHWTSTSRSCQYCYTHTQRVQEGKKEARLPQNNMKKTSKPKEKWPKAMNRHLWNRNLKQSTNIRKQLNSTSNYRNAKSNKNKMAFLACQVGKLKSGCINISK